MAAFSLRGYWRTLSERMAWSPAMTMARLTTTAMTGRLTKRSVKLMWGLPASAVDRPRVELRRRGLVVADHHRGAVAQLEGAGAHHPLAGLQAGDHRHQVAAPLPEPHEPL